MMLIIQIKNYTIISYINQNDIKNSPNKLKLLMFRDSFTMALEPLLSETFAHSIYIWDQNFNNPNYLKTIDDFKNSKLYSIDLDTGEYIGHCVKDFFPNFKDFIIGIESDTGTTLGSCT